MEPVVMRLLSLIDNSGLKENQILKDLDISNGSMISDWRSERSKLPSIKNIIKFAKYFNVSTDYLLIGIENQSNSSSNELQWLDLFHELSEQEQKECYRMVKGYIEYGKK